eukprot:scaffold14066_cov40-Cyclotella_meneghiniana.AAC.6
MRKKRQEHFFLTNRKKYLIYRGDCVDSDPHKRCTGTSMTKYVFINESSGPDFLNFAVITAFIPKETEKTGVSCVADLQSKITFMGSIYVIASDVPPGTSSTIGLAPRQP